MNINYIKKTYSSLNESLKKGFKTFRLLNTKILSTAAILALLISCSRNDSERIDETVLDAGNSSVKTRNTAITSIGGYTLSNGQDLSNSLIKQQNFYFPDGEISVEKNNQGNNIITMAGSSSFIYSSSSVWPQNATQKIGGNFGSAQVGSCSVDNGGRWLNNIERINPNDGNNLVGFYHVEDQWCPKVANDGRYWASIGVAYSNNGGSTFTSLPGKPEGYIIKSKLAKPASKTASGGAGNATVFKGIDNYWYAIYSEKDDNVNNFTLHIARSTNTNALPGTFYKYYNGSFSTPALSTGGNKTSLKNGTSNTPLIGANPSVQWNTKINKYVMVWHKWGGSINVAVSTNLITWNNVQTILSGSSSGPYYEYPSLISPQGSSIATAWTRLYYSQKAQKGSMARQFMVQTLDVSSGL
jgi:hypothetical protein